MFHRAIIALVAVAVLAPHAHAEPRGVALASQDPELLGAVKTALVPWQIRVVAVDAEGLGANVPKSAERARAIARDNDVGAVVWISSDDRGHALWIYDVDGGHAIARILPSEPPLDPATAAAAALSIKTMLRHSAVAPLSERYGADLRRGALSTRLHFESHLGARLRSGEGDLEPRLGLGVGWWVRPAIAATLIVRSGPGVSVDRDSFVGRFTDSAIGAGGRARFDVGGGVSLHPEAVAWIHLTALDGAVLAPEQRAHVGRTNPAAELAATVEWQALPELSVGLRLGGAYLFRKQKYLVLGEPVFAVSSTEWSAGVVLRTRLF